MNKLCALIHQALTLTLSLSATSKLLDGIIAVIGDKIERSPELIMPVVRVKSVKGILVTEMRSDEIVC